MKAPSYWKSRYVKESDPDEIERAIKVAHYLQTLRAGDLPDRNGCPEHPDIAALGRHAYVFAAGIESVKIPPRTSRANSATRPGVQPAALVADRGQPSGVVVLVFHTEGSRHSGQCLGLRPRANGR
jgi:hypothetical protein